MHVIQDEIIRHQLSHDYTLVHQCRWKQSTKVQYFYRLMYIVFLKIYFYHILTCINHIFCSYTFSHFLPSNWLIYYFPHQAWKLDVLFLFFYWLFIFPFLLYFNQYLYLSEEHEDFENFSFNSPLPSLSYYSTEYCKIFHSCFGFISPHNSLSSLC